MSALAHRHLDAEALARLAGLELRVRAVVEGTLSGLHRSPQHGSSVEFAEHKERRRAASARAAATKKGPGWEWSPLAEGGALP